jgi:hypothetical protein
MYCGMFVVLDCTRITVSFGARWLLGVRTAIDISERRHTSPDRLLLVEGGLSDFVQDKLRACLIKYV